ncbi:hypothetical protein [Methylovirgula ligni]|uniref:hypothetical protein n=1 Tax=Methylovirgula ligni TaxID=569860 RepID=UPI001AECE0C4|nr:hypothetical protein [Methylovirgula ligni]
MKQVLDSLAPQLLPADTCYLFQDGGWNPISRIQKASESVILECTDTFSRLIPDGRAFVSSVNLGIAANYRRAEEFVFEALKAQEALFLEDDLVLSPHYLEVTSDLLEIAAAQPCIGYVSAYGDLWASLQEQVSKEGLLQLMHENWGSALTRASWLKQRPVREMYWLLIKSQDYRHRDHDKIRELFRELGYDIHHSSQDASRWIACADKNLLRLTTRTCHARYIGEVGEHEAKQRYKEYRFSESVWYPKRPKLTMPTVAQLEAWCDEFKRQLISGYSHSYELRHNDVRARRRRNRYSVLGWCKRPPPAPLET